MQKQSLPTIYEALDNEWKSEIGVLKKCRVRFQDQENQPATSSNSIVAWLYGRKWSLPDHSYDHLIDGIDPKTLEKEEALKQLFDPPNGTELFRMTAPTNIGEWKEAITTQAEELGMDLSIPEGHNKCFGVIKPLRNDHVMATQLMPQFKEHYIHPILFSKMVGHHHSPPTGDTSLLLQMNVNRIRNEDTYDSMEYGISRLSIKQTALGAVYLLSQGPEVSASIYDGGALRFLGMLHADAKASLDPNDRRKVILQLPTNTIAFGFCLPSKAKKLLSELEGIIANLNVPSKDVIDELNHGIQETKIGMARAHDTPVPLAGETNSLQEPVIVDTANTNEIIQSGVELLNSSLESNAMEVDELPAKRRATTKRKVKDVGTEKAATKRTTTKRNVKTRTPSHEDEENMAPNIVTARTNVSECVLQKPSISPRRGRRSALLKKKPGLEETVLESSQESQNSLAAQVVETRRKRRPVEANMIEDTNNSPIKRRRTAKEKPALQIPKTDNKTRLQRIPDSGLSASAKETSPTPERKSNKRSRKSTFIAYPSSINASNGGISQACQEILETDRETRPR